MQFEFESHTLHIEFAYPDDAVTNCRIIADTNSLPACDERGRSLRIIVGVGKAQRHFKDASNRDTGRKLSLARALEAATNGRMWGPFGLYPKSRVKAFKRAAWTAYLNRKAKPKSDILYTLDEVKAALQSAVDAYDLSSVLPGFSHSFIAVLTSSVLTRSERKQ